MGGESIKPIRKRIHVYFLMTAYMVVDDGIDLVAAKDNKYFHIQVKTANISESNNQYRFTINQRSYDSKDASSTFLYFCITIM